MYSADAGGGLIERAEARSQSGVEPPHSKRALQTRAPPRRSAGHVFRVEVSFGN
jgi:hypothetical protein